MCACDSQETTAGDVTRSNVVRARGNRLAATSFRKVGPSLTRFSCASSMPKEPSSLCNPEWTGTGHHVARKHQLRAGPRRMGAVRTDACRTRFKLAHL